MTKLTPIRALRAALLVGAAAGTCLAGAHADQPTGDAIGTIEGQAIAVTGPMSVEVVHGQVRTILRSGADVRVKSGQAHIDLAEGGRITICGPAHLSVLKAGGALTVALDSGTIHVHVNHEPAVTIYTAQIQAKPMAIGGGALDTLVGFEASGAMCIRANLGAVRVEQQLTAQAMVIPQSGDVVLTNGQLDSLRAGGGVCACEPDGSGSPPLEISKLATAEDLRVKTAEVRPRPVPSVPAPEPAAPKEEPVYQVFMPPLTYDASKKVQSEFDPSLIVLVRRVRVRPTLIFEGRVEGDPAAAESAATPHPAPAAVPAAPKPEAPAGDESVLGRAKALWKRLWSSSS